MFSKQLFYIFGKQTPIKSFVPGATSVSIFRDFVGDKQLNSPLSAFRLGPNINFIRNSGATFINSLSTITFATINQPRFNYSSTGEFLGFLVEDQATNLIPYSTDFTQDWFAPLSAVTITPNITGITAPDNSVTVTLLQPTTGFEFHVISWNGTPAPFEGDPAPIIDTYNRSIFVKKETARYIVVSCSSQVSAFAGGGNPDFEGVANIFDFDLPGFTESSNVDTSYQSYKDGWYRLSLTRKSTNTNTNRLTIGIANGPSFNDVKFSGNSESLSGVYIWGGQAEKGGFSSSYIPTNGTEVIRAADNAYIEGTPFTTVYNLTGGTYFTSVIHNGQFDSRSIATFISENGLKFMTLGTSVSGDKHTFTNTSSPSTIESNLIYPNQLYKLALNLQANNFTLYQDNNFVTTLTAGTLPQPPFRLVRYEIGQFNNTKYLNGHIQKLGYYPFTSTNEQLSTII